MIFKKNRLVIVVSILLVVGFLITSLMGFFVSRASLRNRIIKNELPLTSDNICSEIQQDIMRPIFISSLMSMDTFLRDWILGGEKDIKAITRYLKEIQEKYQTFTSFFVSERTHTYYQSMGILKKVRPEEPRDHWYFRVRQLKENYELNVDLDMANHDALTIFINHKVFDYKGNYIGAAGVGLSVTSVQKMIEHYQKLYQRNIYFVDQKGSFILNPKGQLHLKDNLYNSEGISTIASQILHLPDGIFSYQLQGKTYLLQTRFIPELKWILLVEEEQDRVIEGIHRTLIINLAICLFISGIILALTYFSIRNYQNRIEKLAVTDKLTGLYNRQVFDVILSKMIREQKRKDFPISLIMFDIDHFKSINDRYGHLVGDQVLRIITRSIQEEVRSSDIFCRWGGEEFLILMKDCTRDMAYVRAEEFRTLVKSIPMRNETEEFRVTISLGVTQFNLNEALDQVLNRVDQSLYQAKHEGRNRTVCC